MHQVDGPRDDCRTLPGIAKVIRGARPASSGDPFAPEGVALSAVHVIGFIVLGFGDRVMAVTGIWLIVVAFRTSVVWGVLYIVVPLASLALVMMHWEQSQTPFLICLAGFAVFGVGVYLAWPYLAGSPEFLEALARESELRPPEELVRPLNHGSARM